MAALAIVVLGATSLNRLSIDLFPNINQPVVTVGTIYTGANVQDIEKTVTYPIEKVVSAVPGVHHVESRSRQGISVVQVWFNYDADLNAGQNDIIQRIQQISNSLPSGIKQPFIIRARPLQHPGLPPDRLRRRLRRAAALRHRLQHDRAPDRADHRRGGRQRRRRQDPADRGQPEPRPPVREGVSRSWTSFGRSTTRTSSCRRATSRSAPSTTTCSPTTSSSSSSRWRTSSSARWATCRCGSGTSATSRTRPSSSRAWSASTASAPCTCG